MKKNEKKTTLGAKKKNEHFLTISGYLSPKKEMEKNDLSCEKKESCNGFSHKKRKKEMKKTTLVVK